MIEIMNDDRNYEWALKSLCDEKYLEDPEYVDV